MPENFNSFEVEIPPSPTTFIRLDTYNEKPPESTRQSSKMHDNFFFVFDLLVTWLAESEFRKFFFIFRLSCVMAERRKLIIQTARNFFLFCSYADDRKGIEASPLSASITGRYFSVNKINCHSFINEHKKTRGSSSSRKKSFEMKSFIFSHGEVLVLPGFVLLPFVEKEKIPKKINFLLLHECVLWQKWRSIDFSCPPTALHHRRIMCIFIVCWCHIFKVWMKSCAAFWINMNCWWVEYASRCLLLQVCAGREM